MTSKTKYAGQFLGQDRTFCVIPKPKKSSRNANSPTGCKGGSPDDDGQPTAKRRKLEADTAEHERMEAESEQVRDFADDRSKSKGRWVKCVNSIAGDEITAHQSIFVPEKNPDYHAMLPRARDQVLEWIDQSWYERSGSGSDQAAAAAADESDIDVDEEASNMEEETPTSTSTSV